MHLRTRSGTCSRLAFWNMHLGGFLCEKIPLIRHHARMSQKLRKSRKFLSKTSLQCPKLDWKLVEHTVTLARLQAVENRHSGPNNFRFFREGKSQFAFASEIWELPFENGRGYHGYPWFTVTHRFCPKWRDHLGGLLTRKPIRLPFGIAQSDKRDASLMECSVYGKCGWKLHELIEHEWK